jgi:hypothetical protein|tara:strand:+ start:629 stop:748 length:120 start_codon:yes stop_codon:yes gene_type:complete
MSLLELFIICVLGGFFIGVPIGMHIGFNEIDAKKWEEWE